MKKIFKVVHLIKVKKDKKRGLNFIPVGCIVAVIITNSSLSKLLKNNKWMIANVQKLEVNNDEYNELFTVIGYTYASKTIYRYSSVKEFFKTFKLKQCETIPEDIKYFALPNL